MCAKVADAVLRKCPQVHLMTTSREPLGISGETIYRVPSLSLPESRDEDSPDGSDAVALFVDRARAQGMDLSLDENSTPLVVSICRRLDGMPLAIELAAARMRSMALADLNDRLDQRFRLLTGGSRSALPRQQTLRAAVDWSYSLLNTPEQSVLRRLSVFVDGFDLAAAEAICGFGDIEEFDVTDMVGSLVDKSLLVAEQLGGTVRYRLLETIRQFAGEHLLEHGEDESATVGALHSEHFIALVETAAPHLTGPDQRLWLVRLNADQSNLQRAIEHAARDPDGTASVLRYAAAFTNYRPGIRRSGLLELLMPVLERPEATRDPQLLLGALITAATAASLIDLPTARRLAERAVEIARQLDDDRWLIGSLRVLCSAHNFAGDPGAGLPYGEESVERARLLGNNVLLSQSLTTFLLGSEVIDPVEAEKLFREAIACARRSGDGYLIVMLQNNAAVQSMQTGNIPAARDHLEEATRASHDIGVTTYNVKINMGMVLREEGDLEGARGLLNDALRISRRNGDRFGLAYSTSGLACLAADLGDWRRSAELHGVAQSYLDQIGHPWLTYAHRFREVSIDKVRAHLGDEEFRSFYARGHELSLDRAIQLALEERSG
jgi:non-specific serine/threonine protein kinase